MGYWPEADLTRMTASPLQSQFLMRLMNVMSEKKKLQNSEGILFIQLYLLSLCCAREAGNTAANKSLAFKYLTNALLFVAPNGEMKAEWHPTELNL